MYRAIYFSFGNLPESNKKTRFNEEVLEHYGDLELFNYEPCEEDIGNILYVRHYEKYPYYGIHLVIVKDGDAQAVREAKKKLVESARTIFLEDYEKAKIMLNTLDDLI